MNEHSKDKSLQEFRTPPGEYLTSNQGVRIRDNQNSLKAGERGPTLMEDFILREKITHFDHERIPERVVHARGAGAHGYFQVYESLAEYTSAAFLQDPAVCTPVFVRFSTVVGSRGSADTVRDARGFAIKFYTEEGNFDLVGNNIPVFFIQDALKFPDLVHAVKPEPHNEMPQAAAAHDTFWDFISLVPESMHMIMWVLSDRALPRSYRMMEGFGVHTFRLVNTQGQARFVKFHWKPVLGVHSLVWDEAQKIAGQDPDFNRRDLWEAIAMGDYPEFEFGVQMIEEEDEGKFDFDILDATKLWPEEIVPVRLIGKLTLNRNPDNFFAETEQVAFHPGHVVPGIDFSNDPLLQGRLFSYLDTQLLRLGGPNFAETPINRPLAPVHNNQRDGLQRHTINPGPVSYEPNSLGGGCPMQSPEHMRSYVSYAERIDGHKVRLRSQSFSDHFSQATLFWNSQSAVEKQHIVEGFHFELGKVERKEIRQRMVDLLAKVDSDLAVEVAMGIGIPAPVTGAQPHHSQTSQALSMAHTVKDTMKSRRIAILAAPGVDYSALSQVQTALQASGAHCHLIAPRLGALTSADGQAVEADKSFVTVASVLYDAVFIPGGQQSVAALLQQGNALHFVNEAFKHCKPIAALGEGIELLQVADVQGVAVAGAKSKGKVFVEDGVVTMRQGASLDAFIEEFIQAISEHRHWGRSQKEHMLA